MPTILGLGLAAAVYPQLLAVVVVILTRPNPKRLLLACYFGAASLSMGAAITALLVFRDRSTIAGSSSHRLGASAYLVFGATAVLIAVGIASERGRARFRAALARLRVRRQAGGSGSGSAMKSRTERALARGSVIVAAGVGMLLGVPGPFDLLALGRLARGDYTLVASIALIVVFTLVKFLLIEAPIVSYAIDPTGTATRVHRFSAWMREHKITLLAVVVGAVGVVLVGRGISVVR